MNEFQIEYNNHQKEQECKNVWLQAYCATLNAHGCADNASKQARAAVRRYLEEFYNE